jgi:hypothetical protein
MKTHSKSVLYVFKGNEKDIPYATLMEKIQFINFRLSNFKNVKLIFRYTIKNGKHVPLMSIDNLNDIANKEQQLSDYIMKRLDAGLPHDVDEIFSFSLTYSYEKPIFRSSSKVK